MVGAVPGSQVMKLYGERNALVTEGALTCADATVVYRYEVGDRTWTSQFKSTTPCGAAHEVRLVRVWYSPGNPEESSLTDPRRELIDWALGTVLAATLLPLLVLWRVAVFAKLRSSAR